MIHKAREQYIKILKELGDDEALELLWSPYEGLCVPFAQPARKEHAEDAHTQTVDAIPRNAHGNDAHERAEHAQHSAVVDVYENNNAPPSKEPSDLINPLPAASPAVSLPSAVVTDEALPQQPARPAPHPSQPPLPPPLPSSSYASPPRKLTRISPSSPLLPPVPASPPKIPPSALDLVREKGGAYEPHKRNNNKEEETLQTIKEARRAHLEEELMWARLAIKDRKAHLRLMKRLQQLESQ